MSGFPESLSRCQRPWFLWNWECLGMSFLLSILSFSLTYSAPSPEQLVQISCWWCCNQWRTCQFQAESGWHVLSGARSWSQIFQALSAVHHPRFPWQWPLLGQYVLSQRGMFHLFPLFSPSILWVRAICASEDSLCSWTTESQSFLSSVLTHFIHFCPLSPSPYSPCLTSPQHLDGIGAEEISSISWRSGWHCLPCSPPECLEDGLVLRSH